MNWALIQALIFWCCVIGSFQSFSQYDQFPIPVSEHATSCVPHDRPKPHTACLSIPKASTVRSFETIVDKRLKREEKTNQTQSVKTCSCAGVGSPMDSLLFWTDIGLRGKGTHARVRACSLIAPPTLDCSIDVDPPSELRVPWPSGPSFIQFHVNFLISFR